MISENDAKEIEKYLTSGLGKKELWAVLKMQTLQKTRKKKGKSEDKYSLSFPVDKEWEVRKKLNWEMNINNFSTWINESIEQWSVLMSFSLLRNRYQTEEKCCVGESEAKTDAFSMRFGQSCYRTACHLSLVDFISDFPSHTHTQKIEFLSENNSCFIEEKSLEMCDKSDHHCLEEDWSQSEIKDKKKTASQRKREVCNSMTSSSNTVPGSMSHSMWVYGRAKKSRREEKKRE